MMRIFAVVIIILWSSVAVASEDRIILKWTSFPSNKKLYEFYVKSGKALYLVRNEAAQQPRDDDFPFWQTAVVDQRELGEKIEEVIKKSKKEYKEKVAENRHRGACEGFQWGVDIRNRDFDERYGGHCDSLDIRNQIVNLVESALQIKEKAVQNTVDPG